ncbi:hypothetical protein [Advenella mimigardefordensis]|uniref:hypothetical protein n=1 Tax=Advenella mimigardefordensis TaxID=302406 RepID=UPI00046C8BC9|nr:hypothetical protein [Advenella mimigardefordensis]
MGMDLVELWQSKDPRKLCWKVYGVLEDGCCQVYDKFLELAQIEADRKRAGNLLQKIQHIAFNEDGPNLYTKDSKVCHEAIAGTGIYRLRKDQLRLYFFYDRDHVVICSLLLEKRKDKLSDAEEDRLIKIKQNYERTTHRFNIVKNKDYRRG